SSVYPSSICIAAFSLRCWRTILSARASIARPRHWSSLDTSCATMPAGFSTCKQAWLHAPLVPTAQGVPNLGGSLVLLVGDGLVELFLQGRLDTVHLP